MSDHSPDGVAVKSPVIEPVTEKWTDGLAASDDPPLYELSPVDARKVLRAVQMSVEVDLLPAEIDDRMIPGGPGGEVDIRIVKPGHSSGPLPVIVHLHGGGWILGDKDTHDRLVRELANGAQAMVVFVNYTPAPEAEFPVQIEQAYATLEWVVANAVEIGADPKRIALFGDSVGGNMVAALTMLNEERGGPELEAQVLFYPVTDGDMDSASYETYASGPWLSRPAMEWFWDSYLPDTERRSEPLASPLQAPMQQLRGLAPALVVNGEHDVLRDEGEAYARKLSQAGVPVTQVRYSGTIHDFVLLNPIAQTPAVRAAVPQACEFLRRAFGQPL
jgi:acetyl esterase